jgi:hypothetical protein
MHPMKRTAPPKSVSRRFPPGILPAIALCAALLASCTQTPSGSGFLSTYVDMKGNRYLEAESHLRGVPIEGGVLVVRRVRPYELALSPRVSVERLGAGFEEALAREMEASGLFTAVREERDGGGTGDARWVIEAVITEIEAGLPDASLSPGVSAPGARRVEVEGKILDTRSRRVVLKFKDARAARGGSGSFGTAAEAEADLSHALEETAHGVANTLRQIHAEALRAPAPAH